MSAIQWLTAWGLFLLLLLMIVKTKVGNTIVYYILWLMVAYLIVSHYQEITDIFIAGGITSS